MEVWMLTDVTTPKQSKNVAPTLGSRDYKSPPPCGLHRRQRNEAEPHGSRNEYRQSDVHAEHNRGSCSDVGGKQWEPCAYR